MSIVDRRERPVHPMLNPATLWLVARVALVALVGCVPALDPPEQGASDVADAGVEIAVPHTALEKASSPPTGQPVTLPIEVFGAQGAEKQVTIQVADPSQVTHIYVRCNACGYHDTALDSNPGRVKATLRINGGESIALKHYTANTQVVGNPEIEIVGPEAQYGGIGGGFRTVRFKLPARGLRAGANTFTFTHASPQAPSIGFRIVELNLLRGATPLLSAESFRQSSPTTIPSEWLPPIDTDAGIRQGERLFQTRNLLYDPFLAQIGAVGNGNMVAACADCHEREGRDLFYFNFSNESIIERAKFHRLSQRDGEWIASYIRTYPRRHRGAVVVPQARPYNPPYQPGPGLDGRPSYQWAAGAGIDAVLNRDADIRAHLFPRGEGLPAVAGVVDRFGTLNMRELPVALPMPEWNQWLPPIHPSDAFNTSSAVISADEEGRAVGRPFFDEIYSAAANASGGGPTPATLSTFYRLKSWVGRGATCDSLDKDGGADRYRAVQSPVLKALRLPLDGKCEGPNTRRNAELAKRALAGWISVKLWELIHGNGLEEAPASLPARSVNGVNVRVREARGWLVGSEGQELQEVFYRAPHFISQDSRSFSYQTALEGAMETSAWYHLQMVLNPGYRRTMNSHFAYTINWLDKLESISGESHALRFFATITKMRQLQTNGAYGREVGLDLRTAQPFWLYSDEDGRVSNRVLGATHADTLLRANITQALIDDFIADANYASARDWAAATNNSEVESRDARIPQSAASQPFAVGPYQGTNTYRAIPGLREVGVAQTSINKLTAWCRKTWPNGSWDRLMDPSGANAPLADTIVWRHSAGAVGSWRMKDGALHSFDQIYPQGVPLDWRLIDTGDMNRDGIEDLIWWNWNSGEVVYWKMGANARLVSSHHVAVLHHTSGWHLKAAGDIDRDGTDDLIWWNQSDGAVNWWPMIDGQWNGGGGTIGTVHPSSGWDLRGVGDVTGDGYANLIWRHSSGAVHFWVANNGQYSASLVSDQSPDSQWTLASVGDVNGDGTDDLIWRHNSGVVHWWPMQVGKRMGGFDIGVEPPSSGWQISGVGALSKY